jgi:hypothetical protein
VIAQLATALVFFAGEGVDPSTAAAAASAVKEKLARHGVAATDLSTEHRALLTPKLFVDFTAPPPAFLPPELAGAWKSGSETCAKQTGPSGPESSPQARASAAAVARSCQEALGLALWELLLEQRKLARVVEVELRAPQRSRGLSLSAAVHEPGTRRRLLRLENVSADRAAAASAKAAEDLLGGSAGTEAPARRHPLPSLGMPALDEAAASFPAPKPVVVPASCRGELPGRLEVFPPGKLTRAFEAAYRTVPAEKRTGKPLRCDLVVYPGYEPGQEQVAFARLSCPPAQLRASEPVKEGARLVARLVDQAVAAFCAR